MKRYPVAREPGDFLLGDTEALVVDFDKVNDFLHGLRIRVGRSGLEDFDHGILGFEEPCHRAVEVISGEDKRVTAIDR